MCDRKATQVYLGGLIGHPLYNCVAFKLHISLKFPFFGLKILPKVYSSWSSGLAVCCCCPHRHIHWPLSNIRWPSMCRGPRIAFLWLQECCDPRPQWTEAASGCESPFVVRSCGGYVGIIYHVRGCPPLLDHTGQFTANKDSSET